MTGRTERLIEGLSRPEAYPGGAADVQVVQTHISVVFIAGDLVYKVKKPVDFGFLDFTTPEKRRHFCEREVELNSRYAEGFYLGVAQIYDGPNGVDLIGPGPVIDHAVVMKRIPSDRIMLNMLEQDRITADMLDGLARRLAHFHSRAPSGAEITGFGSPAVIAHNLRENFTQTIPFIGRTIDLETHRSVSHAATEFLASHRTIFHRRMTQGFIKDCHGDLHLDHVVMLNGIILCDCIEFNDRFRYCDVAADIAFLLMDLDFRGYPAYARRLEEVYAQSAEDRECSDLLGFYKSYRAFIRGKVIGFTLDEEEIPAADKEQAAQTAHRYFGLSRSYFMPSPLPALILMCGLSGTGKSYLAGKLSRRLGAEVIRSDEVRKTLHGVDPLQHRLDKYGQGIYRATATEETYAEMLSIACKLLEKGKTIILDASFMLRRHRRAAFAAALKYGVPLRLVRCSCPEDVTRTRLDSRSTTGTDPSDARWETFLQQRGRFEPIAPDERFYVRDWDSTSNADEFLTDFVREFTTGR
ncbi:MAG: AAA family ATPase [Pseudomonadota bacterium]